MMMAYDSSQTPPSRLDDATLEALRAALLLQRVVTMCIKEYFSN